MKEKNIQSIFKNTNKKEGLFELKLCKGTSLPFDAVYDHQIEALMNGSSEKGIYHKISDAPFGHSSGFRFHKPKPFDCLFFRNVPAYVVICWYVPRKKKAFHYIPIREFIQKRDAVERKSITEQMSAEIAEEVVYV